MIDEALSEIGKTPDEFYGYIDSWIEGILLLFEC